MAIRNITYTGTAADGSTTAICVIPTGQNTAQRMGLQVTNGGAVALDAFQLNVRCGKNATWTTIASAAGDFSTPVAPLIRTVGAPVTLAAAATAFILLDCHGIAEVQIAASGNAAACTITVESSLG